MRLCHPMSAHIPRKWGWQKLLVHIPFHPLSDREMEVLSCVVRGMSNKEIAGLLGISHQTVKNHVTSILRKFGVEDRTQAVVYALKRGWVNLQDTDINKPQE